MTVEFGPSRVKADGRRVRIPDNWLVVGSWKIAPKVAPVDSICQAGGARDIGRMRLTSINPATGRKIASYPGHTRNEVEARLARAVQAQTAWRKLSVVKRGRYFTRLARELRRRIEPLAKLATEEMGKPIQQGKAEVEKCALLCDYYAKYGSRLLADERPLAAPEASRVSYEPLGVILAIMPWNFPYWQVVRAAASALISGNTMLLKHAPSVPGCALALEKVFTRAGLPRGVFQVLLIGTEPVPGLMADPRIAGVTLTGSTAAGRNVAALAGGAMKPGVFELGGSDPAIVLEDADVERAAKICAQSRMLNSGQSCVCAKRFIVVRPVLREFTDAFVAAMAAQRMGDPMDARTEVGPLARADLRAQLDAQVKRSVRRGAKILLGGKALRGPGLFYPPSVLANVRPGMPAFDEEIFGPVGAIIAVRDEKEAIRIANQTPYGLAATLFTRDRKRARRLIPQIEAGAVFVNDFVRSSPELPFGGIKQSGHGRELGSWGARAFVNVKTIWEA